MKTITLHKAKTYFFRYLAAVERGEKFVITLGNKPVAMLSSIPKEAQPRRPKVGETLGPQMSVPDSVFAPLTAEELEELLK